MKSIDEVRIGAMCCLVQSFEIDEVMSEPAKNISGYTGTERPIQLGIII